MVCVGVEWIDRYTFLQVSLFKTRKLKMRGFASLTHHSPRPHTPLTKVGLVSNERPPFHSTFYERSICLDRLLGW